MQAECEGQHFIALPRMSASIRSTRGPKHQLWKRNAEKEERKKTGKKRLVIVYGCLHVCVYTYVCVCACVCVRVSQEAVTCVTMCVS